MAPDPSLPQLDAQPQTTICNLPVWLPILHFIKVYTFMFVVFIKCPLFKLNPVWQIHFLLAYAHTCSFYNLIKNQSLATLCHALPFPYLCHLCAFLRDATLEKYNRDLSLLFTDLATLWRFLVQNGELP